MAAPQVIPRYKLTAEEAREFAWIAQLKNLSQFELIVKKLLQKESVSSVSRWIEKQHVPERYKNIGFHTWRKYIGALHKKLTKDYGGIKLQSIRPLAYQAVIEKAQHEEIELANQVPFQEQGQRIYREVEKAAKSMNSEFMLKMCFVIQQGRVEMMLGMESAMKMPFAWGYKDIQVLKEIAAEVRKHEVGENWMDGKVPGNRGPFPRGLLPTAGTQIVPTEFGERLRALNEVNRNLLIAAGSKVIHMINLEARIERSETVRLESNSPRTVPEE